MANSSEQVKRLRRARRWLYRRAKLSEIIDTTLTAVASKLHMCGEGRRHNWSVLFAQLFFTDCPCCLFYRGAAVGAIFSLVALVAASAVM